MNKKEAPIKLLCCIVPRNIVDKVASVLDNLEACATWSMLGYHIKYKKVSTLMGLGDCECTAILSIIPTKTSKQIVVKMDEILHQYSPVGSAFTISINAVSRNTLNGLLDMQNLTKQALQSVDKQLDKREDE